MLTRSLIVAAVFAFVAFPLSGAQAGSKGGSHNQNGATNHQVSSGSGTAQAKQNKPKKTTKPALSDITVTKTKDKASPQ